jgi:hypothetical protein
MIGLLLHQGVFSALVLLAAFASQLRPDRKSLALFFYALAYFSTQIPFYLGWELVGASRVVIMALVSLALMFFYTTIPSNRYIIVAAICESLLILLQIGSVISELHPWPVWAITCIINYVSFISLCLNKWGAGEHERRSGESDNRLDYIVGYVRYLRVIIRKTHPGKGECKDSG